MNAKELREVAQQILDCNDILGAIALCYEIYKRGVMEGMSSNEGEEVTRG